MAQPSATTDDVLIAKTLSGDESAYDELMRRHAGPVRSLIAHYFQDRAQVDDLAPETFVKAYFAMKGYRGEAPFIFWLKQIAVRLCIDELRRRKSRREFAGREAEEGESLSEDQRAEERLNARVFLRELLVTLSPLDRMILVLLDGEGHSADEVGKLTGLTRTNVKVRAYRIRRRLRSYRIPEVVHEEESNE